MLFRKIQLQVKMLKTKVQKRITMIMMHIIMIRRDFDSVHIRRQEFHWGF